MQVNVFLEFNSHFMKILSVSISLLCFSLVLDPVFTQALFFEAPENTQIYADPACKPRPREDGPNASQKRWIDCDVDGRKTSILLSRLPTRFGKNWFGFGDAADIVDEMAQGTAWEGKGSSISFHGATSNPGEGMTAHFQTSGTMCDSDERCALEGDKVHLVVIGTKTATVGLLAIGEGYIDELVDRQAGDGRVVGRQLRLPWRLEAMIASFNFRLFDMTPTMATMKADFCKGQPRDTCDIQP